jgi:hypothetical protein
MEFDESARKIFQYEMNSDKASKNLKIVRSIQNMADFTIWTKACEKLEEQNKEFRREKFAFKSRIQWASDIEISIVERYLLQVHFEHIIGRLYGKEISLNDYCWTEAFDKDTFFQILNKVKLFYDNYTLEFSKTDGSVLIVFYNKEKDVTKTSNIFDLPHKKPFGQLFSSFSEHLDSEKLYFYSSLEKTRISQKEEHVYSMDGSKLSFGSNTNIISMQDQDFLFSLLEKDSLSCSIVQT